MQRIALCQFGTKIRLNTKSMRTRLENNRKLTINENMERRDFVLPIEEEKLYTVFQFEFASTFTVEYIFAM